MKNAKPSKTIDLDTSQLFRMPWTNSDNAFSWLEITHRCNLNCDYCYQNNYVNSDKDIIHIEQELQVLLKLRKADTMFISGGEPLLHPQIKNIVRTVSSHKLKPVIVTNGALLTAEMTIDLKNAGLFGFVFHVDSGQSRPGWTGKSEKELNQLRQKYADMVYNTKGLVCGFNTTILPETLHEVPDIVEWTIKNIRKVCTNSLIPVRVTTEDDPWDLFVKGKKVDFKDTAFSTKKYKNLSGINLTANDIYKQIQKVVPKFRGNAFLGGTEVPDAPKWLFCNIIGTGNKIFGNLGPKAMETLQNGFHFLSGRFLSFLKPGFYSRAKLLFPLGVIDKEIRKSALSYLSTCLKNPRYLFKNVFIQSLLVLQPQDVLPSGKQDLCDGCPNKTVHNGQLVSMCRVEEFISFGDMVTFRPKQNNSQHYLKLIDKTEKQTMAR